MDSKHELTLTGATGAGGATSFLLFFDFLSTGAGAATAAALDGLAIMDMDWVLLDEKKRERGNGKVFVCMREGESGGDSQN